MPSRFSTQGRDNWAPLCAMTVEGTFRTSATIAAHRLAVRRRRDNRQRPGEMPAISPGLSERDRQCQRLQSRGSTATTAARRSKPARAPIPSWKCAFPATADGAGRTGARHAGAGWANISAAPALVRAGRFSQPGFLAEFRMLACAPLRVEGSGANESLSGRGRKLSRKSVPPPGPARPARLLPSLAERSLAAA
jgi:hypothetical protein